mmetsp:Transcript_9349/g.21087  ORF Transcript_9349/g.21087 Transcript_9349/m.21087 type:complete len:546 (+) Transcript_9349:107-1744(+)
MSGRQELAKGEPDGNPNHLSPPPKINAKNNAGHHEQVVSPPTALYWSVLHHKNLHEGLPTAMHIDSTRQNMVPPKEESRENGSIPRVIHERQPLISDVSTRSALSGYGSAPESPAVSPPTLPQQSSESADRKNSGWGRVREIVQTNELLIRHMPEAEGSGGDAAKTRRWSDLSNTSYELTLRECLILFLALIAVGVLAYSFLFEQWSIIDAIYFTTVLLTTVGYGDITPTTPGGKLFASLFALAGIVLLGLVLGVVGSQIVEAEIKYTEKMTSRTSRALEHAFTMGSHHKRGEEDKAAHDNMETAERPFVRRYSSSSTGSIQSISDSTCSSVYDQDSSFTNSISKHGRHHERRENHKRFPGLSVIQRHLPGFTPMLIGGVTIALLNGWGWQDSMYYCVVTATTIGFGDLTPQSDISKAVAILFVPIAVASMGYILGNVASFIVESRRAEHTKKLWSSELKMEDIEALDEANDGGVSELEYIKFMLVAMKKIDGELFDDLREQFLRLDMTGDGRITKKDLTIMATRRLRKVSHKLELRKYKVCSLD